MWKKRFLPRNLCAEVLHELNISAQKDLHMEVFYPLTFLCPFWTKRKKKKKNTPKNKSKEVNKTNNDFL